MSLEFKPTDESTRFSIVPSTGAALLLARDVDRPNFGLTLDVGHLLMAGENPAQSVAAVGAAGKLFGMQVGMAANVKLHPPPCMQGKQPECRDGGRYEMHPPCMDWTQLVGRCLL